MNLSILSLLTGIFVGALFTFLNLPIPAPGVLAGIMGIVGIYLGYIIMAYFGFHL